jgi:hypothetical protein
VGTPYLVFALQVAGYIAFLPGVWQLGNQFCRLFLRLSGAALTADKQSQTGITAGRYIGLLERLLIILGLVMGSWEVMAAVVAVKTVARYKELDDQIPAEYFLVGSLASILWAVAIAGLLVVYDSTWGFGLIELLHKLLPN